MLRFGWKQTIGWKQAKSVAVIALLMLFFVSGAIASNASDVRTLQRDSKQLTGFAPFSFGTSNIRWHDNTGVVYLFVADGSNIQGWQAWHAALLPNALQAWQPVIGQRLQFQFVADPRQADVIVEFVPNFANYRQWGLSRNTIGVTTRETMGKTMVRNDIHLALYDNDGIFNTQGELQASATHEIGHMLGITDHSSNPSDLMYRANSITYPTPNDNATLQRIYNAPADISNRPGVRLARYRETPFPNRPPILPSSQNSPPVQQPTQPSTTPEPVQPPSVPPAQPAPSSPNQLPDTIEQILKDPSLDKLEDLIRSRPWRWRRFHS